MIYGDNGTGKTSILDAILWCTHGKNIESRLSHGPSGFSITPLNKDGSKIECDTDVIIAIENNGKVDLIKRSLSGSETKLSINDEPVLAKEYDTWIEENISSQDLFRMYSNPLYFPSLPWQDRRKRFTDLMPTPDVNEVLDSMEVKVEKAIADKIRSMPVEKVILSEHENLSKYEKEQIRISSKIDLLNDHNAEYVKVDSLDLLVAQRDDLESRIKQHTNDMNEASGRSRALNQARFNIDAIADKIKRRESDLTNTHDDAIYGFEKAMATAKAMAEELYVKRNQLDTNTVDTICPACGQDLPEDKVATSKESIIDLIATLDTQIKEQRAKFDNAKTEKENIGNLALFINDETYVQFMDDKTKAMALVKDIENDPAPEITDMSTIRAEYEAVSKTISSYDDYQRNVIELREYKAALGLNARSLEMSQRAEKDAGLYIVARAEFLVKQAQANFDTISVKLFHKLVNGKVRECFEITKDGVPYSDLNRAGKFQAGTEFIQFFEKQNPMGIPIIADDFESYPSINITDLVGPGTQTITTMVKYGQKELICQTK